MGEVYIKIGVLLLALWVGIEIWDSGRVGDDQTEESDYEKYK